jgi:hypothetical protein
MPKIKTRNDSDRMTAVRLLRAGYATVGELATMLGCSHQRLDHWRRVAGIDAQAARKTYLARAWSRLATVPRQRPATRAGTTKNGRVITEA